MDDCQSPSLKVESGLVDIAGKMVVNGDLVLRGKLTFDTDKSGGGISFCTSGGRGASVLGNFDPLRSYNFSASVHVVTGDLAACNDAFSTGIESIVFHVEDHRIVFRHRVFQHVVKKGQNPYSSFFPDTKVMVRIQTATPSGKPALLETVECELVATGIEAHDYQNSDIVRLRSTFNVTAYHMRYADDTEPSI